jgi:hypothetical protein
MEYALLIYGEEKFWAARTDEDRREVTARHDKFARMLVQRGAMRGGKELALASNATTLRRQRETLDDAVSVTDGPYAETAEILGGFYLIEAADLDEAIALAKELPELTVEVRPIVPGPEA